MALTNITDAGINRNKPEETILEKKPEPVDVEHMELEK